MKLSKIYSVCLATGLLIAGCSDDILNLEPQPTPDQGTDEEMVYIDLKLSSSPTTGTRGDETHHGTIGDTNHGTKNENVVNDLQLTVYNGTEFICYAYSTDITTNSTNDAIHTARFHVPKSDFEKLAALEHATLYLMANKDLYGFYSSEFDPANLDIDMENGGMEGSYRGDENNPDDFLMSGISYVNINPVPSSEGKTEEEKAALNDGHDKDHAWQLVVDDKNKAKEIPLDRIAARVDFSYSGNGGSDKKFTGNSQGLDFEIGGVRIIHEGSGFYLFQHLYVRNNTSSNNQNGEVPEESEDGEGQDDSNVVKCLKSKIPYAQVKNDLYSDALEVDGEKPTFFELQLVPNVDIITDQEDSYYQPYYDWATGEWYRSEVDIDVDRSQYLKFSERLANDGHLYYKDYKTTYLDPKTFLPRSVFKQVLPTENFDLEDHNYEYTDRSPWPDDKASYYDVTGVSFKAKINPTTDWAKQMFDGEHVVYAYKGNVIGQYNDLKSYTGTNATEVNAIYNRLVRNWKEDNYISDQPSQEEFEQYVLGFDLNDRRRLEGTSFEFTTTWVDKFYHGATYDDHVSQQLAKEGFFMYWPTADDHEYYCYYYSPLYDCDDESAPDGVRYAVVRNHLYDVKVLGITGLGYPGYYIPETPEPPKYISNYMNLSIKVAPWTKRDNRFDLE